MTAIEPGDSGGVQWAGGRGVGPIGTIVRVLALLWVLRGLYFTGGFPTWWQHVLGLVGLPVLYVAIQAGYARWRPKPSPWIGPVAWVVVAVPAMTLYFLPVTRPALVLTVALMILLSAVRGNADCEATVVGNWVLQRADRLWCPLFSPVDALERHLRGRRTRQTR